MKTRFSTVRFGVNYVPSQKWWFCWNDFEADKIARDLDAISAMGADHIRVMLIWPFFQPNRRAVSEAHLDRLDGLMELATARGLDVCVTMLTGWLSGWSFRPTFDKPETFYTDASLVEPVTLYFTRCAERLNRHRNFLGFDLGNELNCCWKTPSLDEGDAWTGRMLDLCEQVSPQAVHVNGVDHQPWFYPETFSAGALARRHEIIPLHCWIEFTGARRRSGPLERACTHLAPAMAALARAYAGDAAKPVWVQEFGASGDWMERAQIPVFLEDATVAALQGGVSWVTWWASHDIRPEYEFSSLEYDLGLLDTDNRLKPAGEAFKRLAAEWKGRPALSAPKLELPPLPVVVGVSREQADHNTWAWLEAVQAQM